MLLDLIAALHDEAFFDGCRQLDDKMIAWWIGSKQVQYSVQSNSSSQYP
jgi:hypothetical protein